MKVLVVDDDLALADVLSFAMRRAGYEVVLAYDGLSALQVWEAEEPDLVILDLNLPGMDGLEVCRHIRAGSQMPIVILSVRDREEDIAAGLKCGADDYIVKPFSPRKLVARVEAVLRPDLQTTAQSGLLNVGELTLDPAHKELRCGGQKTTYLTRLESRLLEILLRNCGQMVSAEALIQHIWGSAGADHTMLKELVYGLRRKMMEGMARSVHLDLVNGEGYILTPTNNPSNAY